MKLNNYERDGYKKYKKRNHKKHYKINPNKEEELLSSAYLLLKFCLFSLAIISFIKLVHISRVRVTRLKEINESYIYEKDKFKKLTNRFDNLLSLKGEQRFMKDQDQMITRDILRVIWR
tara:strand:- start:1930 stop:2286 length:357 start_codon:yes stop_codon:yes gene_type:complete